MFPDDFQQAWQTQSSQTRVTVDANLLAQQVQRNQRDFGATIVRRDTVEIAVGLLLLPYWIYQGIVSSLPWTWYLTIPAILWVIGFLLVDRRRHPQSPSEPDAPLAECVKTSLRQVEHQIWLLRNVFWWYLLPFTIAILAFFADATWGSMSDWHGAMAFALLCGFLLALYGFIWYLNQRAVRVDLEPRREELLGLLAGLAEEPGADRQFAERDRGHVQSCSFPRWAKVLASVVPFGIWAASYWFTHVDDDTRDRVIAFVTGPEDEPEARRSGAQGDALAAIVMREREDKQLVGLAAMVMVDGKMQAAAAQGERKLDSGVPLELSDRWHVGGISKSVTATMIARLVEAGTMEWTDTVGEAFAHAKVHEQWKPVTLRQLLTDTAGAPANLPKALWSKRPAEGPERMRARRDAALQVVAEKPEYPPGSKRVYSNVGYTIAGAMAEKATGESWEDLVRREVFAPLKFTGAGFGAPESSDDALEQPRGHWDIGKSKFAVDDQMDNTPIIGPAATVHMTLAELCTFATEHLQGEAGGGTLLSAETYKKLHELELDEYACGWLRREPSDKLPFTAYWHNGSNKAWYALVAFIPERKLVVAVTTNDGDSRAAEAAAWEIVEASAELRKESPFSAVRWKKAQPEVEVDGAWYKLVSIDGVAAEGIVAFSQKTYDARWRKRFEEDLVEVLTRMGRPPGETARLEVRQVGTDVTRVLEAVPWSAANRSAIWDAGRERED